MNADPENRVLIVGDLNCARYAIDHCDPESDPDFDDNPARLWLNTFLCDAEGEYATTCG